MTTPLKVRLIWVNRDTNEALGPDAVPLLPPTRAAYGVEVDGKWHELDMSAAEQVSPRAG